MKRGYALLIDSVLIYTKWGDNEMTVKRFLVQVPIFFAGVALLIIGTADLSKVNAAPYAVGDKVCMECHKAEHEVWSGTKHFKSYRKVHKNKKAKAIVKSIGGKSMKKTEACALCHYTKISKKAGKKPKVKAGPLPALISPLFFLSYIGELVS